MENEGKKQGGELLWLRVVSTHSATAFAPAAFPFEEQKHSCVGNACFFNS